MNTPPLQVVQDVYQAFANRDLAKIFALLSPEIEMVQSADLPWGGVFRGHDGARRYFMKLTSRINSTLEVERLIDSGDHIAAVGWTQGHVISTGAKYRIPIVHLWTVRDGLVTRVQFCIDNPPMLAAVAENGK